MVAVMKTVIKKNTKVRIESPRVAARIGESETGGPALQQCRLDLDPNWNRRAGRPRVGNTPGGRSSLIETRRWNKRVIGRSNDERGSNDHLRRCDHMQMANRAAIVILRSLIGRSRFVVARSCLRVVRTVSIQYRFGNAGMDERWTG